MRQSQLLRWGAGALATLLITTQGYASSPQLNGEITSGLWSSNRMLDDRHAVSSNRLKLNLYWQASDNLQLRSSVSARSSQERLNDKREGAGVDELYIRNRGWPCTAALGKKLVIWGRADGINPTDLVSPTNYRRLTPETNDQRTGNWGLHLDCAAGQGRLQMHVLDRFRFNDVPLRATPGVQFIEQDPSVRPTLAIKYDVLASSADWSVSFIDGHDPFPTFALRNITPQGITLDQYATRMRMLGSDLTLVRGETAYRAEIAWVDFQQASTASVARRRPYTSLIAGAEWYLGDRETLSLQGFLRHLRSVSTPSSDPLLEQIQEAQSLVSNELDTKQYGITFRYARPLLDSKAAMDIFAVWTEPRGDWMLRGRLKYALTDSWRINTGFEFFRGPGNAFLGQLRKNSLTFVEASYLW